MSRSSARHAAIAALVPPAALVVDVGADHGEVAHIVGAIAVERRPHRAGAASVPWVIADGLRPFRHVPVAILAGMGARTIARILVAGPTPDVVVAHVQDDPGWLRVWLASHGWRLDAETLAVEGERIVEILRAVPGEESASGPALRQGPRLLEGHHPLREAWLEARIAQVMAVQAAVGHAHLARAEQLAADLVFLRAQQHQP